MKEQETHFVDEKRGGQTGIRILSELTRWNRPKKKRTGALDSASGNLLRKKRKKGRVTRNKNKKRPARAKGEGERVGINQGFLQE